MRPIPRRGALVALTAPAAAFLLSSCGILANAGPPPSLFTLSPKSTFPDDLPRVDWQLGVTDMEAPAGLSTPKVAVSRDPYTLEYFAGAQWIDSAPNMVQRLLIESFENSGRIVGVGRTQVLLRNDLTLRAELREFQAEYLDGPDSPPSVRVRINAKLVQMPQRKIVASETFERLVKAPDNRQHSIKLRPWHSLNRARQRRKGTPSKGRIITKACKPKTTAAQSGFT